MFQIDVKLENRTEHIPFYSKWAAIEMCKKIGQCVDVKEAAVIDLTTGEVYIIYQEQRLTWAAGYGEF